MKLYTRRGDDGSTDLFGGQRVAKDARRIEAIGAVDELNAFIGLAAAGGGAADFRPMLASVQARLFEIGADLATPGAPDLPASAAPAPGVDEGQVEELERWIDAACAPLPAMRHFILPGGTETAARLHAARAVCRRAERHCVALAHVEPVNRPLLIYLNRLSDLLFALARRANQLAGVEDVPWMGRQR